MNEPLATLLRLNLALAAAVALVMALRLPVRRLFGASVAYGLWSLLPLAGLAMLLPARVVTVVRAREPVLATPATAAAPPAHAALSLPPGLDLDALLAGLWIAGAAASLAWLAWRQIQFGRALRAGRAGPAVIGLVHPRVVTPDDFEGRYTAREQLVILAHERTHIARQDPRINATLALARCVLWFNPLVHLAAHYLRIDQEYACDAQVVAAHPTARRSYAEAMLKTQLARRPLPLGCYWPAETVHPLAERIRLLSRKTPGRGQRLAGTAAVAVLAAAAGWSAWDARPAEVVETVVQGASAPIVTAEAAPQAPGTPAPTAPTAKPAQPAQPFVAATAVQAEPALTPLLVATVPVAAAPTAVDDGPPPGVRIARIHSAAELSAVTPGSAVRVLATMTDREGHPLVTDLTAYGSQRAYRTGYFTRDGSRQSLFTSVVQEGDRLLGLRQPGQPLPAVQFRRRLARPRPERRHLPRRWPEGDSHSHSAPGERPGAG